MIIYSICSRRNSHQKHIAVKIINVTFKRKIAVKMFNEVEAFMKNKIKESIYICISILADYHSFNTNLF